MTMDTQSEVSAINEYIRSTLENNALIADAAAVATREVIKQRLPAIKGLSSLINTSKAEIHVKLTLDLDPAVANVRAELQYGVVLEDVSEVPISTIQD